MVGNVLTGRARNTETGSIVSGDYPTSGTALDFLLNATQEELDLIGVDTDELYQMYLRQEQEKASQLALFWEEVDALNERILSMTEDELREAFYNASLARGIQTAYHDTYTLPKWIEVAQWNRFHNTWYCGPNVISFILLGLGTNSGYPNIPTSNNDDRLQAFYREVVGRLGDGPKLFHWFDGDSLNGALTDLTGNRCRLTTHWSIPTIASHNWGMINTAMRGSQLPAISLRWPKINDISGGFHYRTVIGTRVKKTEMSTKVLWWTVTIPLWSEGQYLMNDNGADGGSNRTWWEGDSLYHFQAASVKRN